MRLHEEMFLRSRNVLRRVRANGDPSAMKQMRQIQLRVALVIKATNAV